MTKMVIANSDNWIGIYIDGELSTEDHLIEPSDAVQLAIENDVTQVENKYINQDWLDDVGALPPDISDVVWEDQEWELKEEDD